MVFVILPCMKAIRIFLFVLIVIGIGFLVSEKLWVSTLVAFIVEREQEPQILAVSAVDTQVPEAPADITLGVGEKGTVGNLEITFNALVQDSRCPIDVQCIQAGAVNTNVTFKEGSHIETKNMPSDEVPQRFGEYMISIVQIAPPRKSKKEISPPEYRITFHISK